MAKSEAPSPTLASSKASFSFDAPTPGPHPLDRESPLPLWSQLQTELTRRLKAEEFAEGFPTEQELTVVYDVSRSTVREALRRLNELGLIQGRRGQGRTVRASPQPFRTGALFNLITISEGMGLPARSDVRAFEIRTDAAVALRLALGADAPLVYLERIRLAAGEPLAIDRAWLPASLAAGLLEVDFSDALLYEELAARCGIRPDAGKEYIRAIDPDAESRGVLELPDGTGAFQIERLTLSDSIPVEWRSTIVRGDRFELLAEWSMTSGMKLSGQVPSNT